MKKEEMLEAAKRFDRNLTHMIPPSLHDCDMAKKALEALARMDQRAWECWQCEEIYSMSHDLSVCDSGVGLGGGRCGGNLIPIYRKPDIEIA